MLYSVYLRYKELVHYLIVGIMTTVVSLGSYYLLTITVLDIAIPQQLQMGNVLSWVAAVLFAYITNRKFVFLSSNAHVIREFASFIAARLGSLLVDMGAMFLMVTIMGINDKVAKLLVQIIIVVVNYLFSKLFVFRKSRNTEK